MKCLTEKFTASPDNQLLWISRSIGDVHSNLLLQVLSELPYADFYGKRVAIGNMSVLEFVCSLIFLDGIAETILVLPVEDDPQARAHRLEQARIDIVLENDALGIEKSLLSVEPVENVGVKNLLPFCPTTWLLPTSGTTASPKLIHHTFGSLTRSLSFRQFGSEYIWGSLYSLRRFAGLQVFMQAWLCGTPMILTEEVTKADDFLNYFIDHSGNALSGTPSMWRKIAMHPEFHKLALKQITLGGEIVDQGCLNMLAACFPDARITHIYASTEAGVGFAVRDKKAGFPREYLENSPWGVPMCVNEAGHLLFQKKPLNGSNSDDLSDWIDSGDVVCVGDDRVFFLGRANGSINIGGNKVMPEEVECVIKEIPEVAYVHVHSRKSSIVGNLIEAAILPTNGTAFDEEFKKNILRHCRNRLDAFKVPSFIVQSTGISLSPSGKRSMANKK